MNLFHLVDTLEFGSHCKYFIIRLFLCWEFTISIFHIWEKCILWMCATWTLNRKAIRNTHMSFKHTHTYTHIPGQQHFSRAEKHNAHRISVDFLNIFSFLLCLCFLFFHFHLFGFWQWLDGISTLEISWVEEKQTRKLP